MGENREDPYCACSELSAQAVSLQTDVALRHYEDLKGARAIGMVQALLVLKEMLEATLKNENTKISGTRTEVSSRHKI